MRFLLKTLFLLLAVLGSSLALFGVYGFPVFVLAVELAAYLYGFRSCLLHGCVIVLTGVVLIALSIPVWQFAVTHAHAMQCSNNLKQIAVGLWEYHKANGQFPPAYIADKHGRPMHSWRVLILPYMEQESLYKQYDFNEPWDAPNNKKLLALRPRFYSCPRDENSILPGATQTNYVAVVGANAAWMGEKAKSLDDAGLHDKASSTIMVVETANAGIPWTEPKDLSLDALEAAGAKSAAVTVSSKHGCYSKDFFFTYVSPPCTYAHVAFADGSVRSLTSGNLEANRLRKLLRIGGCRREEIDPFGDHVEPKVEWRVNWDNCGILASWLASVGLLFYGAVKSRKPQAQRME